jgi:DNA (cytosine-5)-methyltransferase 1
LVEKSTFPLPDSRQMAPDRLTRSSFSPISFRLTDERLAITGLFAGIAGFEEGFRQEGHATAVLCESDSAARRVLAHHFPRATLVDDIRDLTSLPGCDVITAGFPCQDLSQVGRTKGISGDESILVNEVFRILRNVSDQTKWLILENVPFMLRLHKGDAIRHITDTLNELGWNWAYRTIDTRSFGLPQRRLRVFLIASRTFDPRAALLAQDAGLPISRSRKDSPRGFYWTEGHRGLGRAVDAVPPLKGGSGVSIPSPPAVWFPRRRSIVVPSIEAAERFQGFSAGWTLAAQDEPNGERRRWRLVGNAVSVPVAAWLAGRLTQDANYDDAGDEDFDRHSPWPAAAWKFQERMAKSQVSSWPLDTSLPRLVSFLGNEVRPLSLRAASGFLSRLEHSSLHHDEEFISGVRHYVMTIRSKEEATTPARPIDSKVSRRMANTRGRDNGSELALRSALHKKGYRFRIHHKAIKGLRRTADIAFPSLRVAIFIDGCFWHGCPIHGTWPKHNAAWWRDKIETNRKRDRDTDLRLKKQGWTVARAWEHESADVVARRISHLLDTKKARRHRLAAQRRAQ